MDYPLLPPDIHLFYDASFVQEIDRVLDLNLSQPLDKLALLISLLRKGIQNLSNSEQRVRNEENWNTLSYSIENIGSIFFHIIQDSDTGDTFLQIIGIRWKLKESYFFHDFSV